MKIKLLLLTFCLCFITIEVVAQAVQVRTERDVQGDILFNAEAQELGSYTLALELSDVKGYKSFSGPNPRFILSSGKKYSFLRLKKEDKGPYSYRYKYRYYLGRYDAKPEFDYPYILPIEEGQKVRVGLVRNIGIMLNKEVNDSVLGFSFKFPNEIDTVHAIRSGYVVRIDDRERDKKLSENGNMIYDSPSRCDIYVEHKDGTLARYTIQEGGEALLSLGDRVLAGKAIGVFSGSEIKTRGVSISLYYLNSDLENIIFLPKFYMDGQVIDIESRKEYESARMDDIIKKELSKKEKKKLGLK